MILKVPTSFYKSNTVKWRKLIIVYKLYVNIYSKKEWRLKILIYCIDYLKLFKIIAPAIIDFCKIQDLQYLDIQTL